MQNALEDKWHHQQVRFLQKTDTPLFFSLSDGFQPLNIYLEDVFVLLKMPKKETTFQTHEKEPGTDSRKLAYGEWS